MADNSPLVQALLQRLIALSQNDDPATRDMALDQATGIMNKSPITPGNPGFPPSPEAASSMQAWFPKGITKKEQPGTYDRVKPFAEYNNAVQQLQTLLGKK